MAAATGAEVGGACGHHAQRDVCASRAKYREGRRPRAVKVGAAVRGSTWVAHAQRPIAPPFGQRRRRAGKGEDAGGFAPPFPPPQFPAWCSLIALTVWLAGVR